MQRLSNSRPVQTLLPASDDMPAGGQPRAASAGPSYLRSATKPSGVIPKPLRKINSHMHFPVGFGPATSKEQAASSSSTFAEKIDHWANTATTEQGQNINRAVQLLNFAEQTGAETLDMRGLRLTSLPDCLHELSSLEELNLSDNRLGEIPPLPRFLTSLDLRRNEAVELPTISRTLHDLKVDPSVAARKLQEMERLAMKLRESL